MTIDIQAIRKRWHGRTGPDADDVKALLEACTGDRPLPMTVLARLTASLPLGWVTRSSSATFGRGDDEEKATLWVDMPDGAPIYVEYNRRRASPAPFSSTRVEDPAVKAQLNAWLGCALQTGFYRCDKCGAVEPYKGNADTDGAHDCDGGTWRAVDFHE